MGQAHAARSGRERPVSGILGDPKRQANDALRGYVYQVLRSVLVWLDLGDEEKLYLEGAEDLDRIYGDAALTEQVKDTAGSGNITLRTRSVIDAINHFWGHAGRNPGVTLRFRYLTTSRAGIEMGKPFGAGRGGLDVWNGIAAAPHGPGAEAAAKSLADFLLAEGSVDQPVLDFLARATPQQILSQLVVPIEWVTGQQDGTALIQQIKDRLVAHGAAAGITPADSEAAFDALCTAAFDAAAKKDDVALTRAQFLRIFAGATAIQLPKQDLLALVRTAMAAGPAGALAIQAPIMLFEGPPPLPARYFRRAAQELLLETALAGGSVLLHGSTGTGKTLTAASHFVGREALWLPLRDLPPAEVRSRLMTAAQMLRAEGEARILIIDDLDALADPRLIEASLAGLWRCQRELGGQLVVTSDRPLPARLGQAVELVDARELQMQPFDRAEIEAFLQQSDCPSDRVATWGGILELSTLGHPQLINARIAALADAGFPAARAEDLLGNAPDVDRIRFEARRLIADLPDGPRELLYRASLVTGRITRQHLIAIARIGDAIREPGDAIDVIAGPWLEATEDKSFRISPLARGAAEEARGLSWVKAMHGQVAWTYLVQRTLTPWDISSVLMHCYVSGSAGPLVHIMQSLFSADEEVWSAIAEACGIYAPLGLGAGDVMPFARTADLFIFRIFQYRIAAEADVALAMRIAAKLDEEFAAAPDDDAARFCRMLYLSQFLSLIKVRYPMAVIVARAEEFFRLAAAMEASLPERMARTGKALDVDIPASSYSQFVGLRLISHVHEINDLDDLMQALETIPAEDACAMLESISGLEDISSLLVERTWLAEHRAAQNDWPAYCAKLRNAFDFCGKIGATAMAGGIAPVLIRTINEDLGDPKGALETASDISKVGVDDPLYRCALAKVTSDAGDFPAALTIWQNALPQWPEREGNVAAAFAFRTAGIASAKHDHWADAAGFFGGAARLVDRQERPTFALGLAMDAAFCRFHAGDRPTAISEFGSVVAALAPMQADYEVEPLLSLQRRAGGVLTALVNRDRQEVNPKNLIGMCSNLDPLVTDASVAPPLDTLRLNLIILELAHGASLNCSLREAPLLRTSPIMSFRSVAAGPLFTLAQRTRDFTDVVSDALLQLDALAMLAEQIANNDHDVMRHHDGKIRPWTEGSDELLIGRIIIALFDLAAADELDRLPLERWRADAAVHPNAVRVVGLINHIEKLFMTGETDAWATVLNSTAADWSVHVASALAATLLERLAPDALLVCHALWAHYFVQPHIRGPIATAVELMVRRRWRLLTAMPANFVAPRTSIPRLLSAIDDPSHGWSKVRMVLQAALDAAPLPAGHQSRVIIEAMTD